MEGRFERRKEGCRQDVLVFQIFISICTLLTARPTCVPGLYPGQRTLAADGSERGLFLGHLCKGNPVCTAVQ